MSIGGIIWVLLPLKPTALRAGKFCKSSGNCSNKLLQRLKSKRFVSNETELGIFDSLLLLRSRKISDVIFVKLSGNVDMLL